MIPHLIYHTMGNKTALITGASSGIGLELAKLFARDNYHLVIVARGEQDLDKAAETLKSIGAPQVTVIPQDLSKPEGPEQLYHRTKELGLKIDVLVNDAGVGAHGLFTETDLDTELGIIQLNIASLVYLTKVYLKDMLARGNGRILQLASVASYQPTPKLTVYAATKAFVLSFTDALSNELEGKPVTITALIPGATDTDFFRKAGAENTKATEHLEDPAVVARIGYEALMSGEHHAYAPGVKQQVVMSSLSSNQAVANKARKQMEPSEKKELEETDHVEAEE